MDRAIKFYISEWTELAADRPSEMISVDLDTNVLQLKIKDNFRVHVNYLSESRAIVGGIFLQRSGYKILTCSKSNTPTMFKRTLPFDDLEPGVLQIMKINNNVVVHLNGEQVVNVKFSEPCWNNPVTKIQFLGDEYPDTASESYRLVPKETGEGDFVVYVYCTMYIVQCILYNVYCTIFIVHMKLRQYAEILHRV